MTDFEMFLAEYGMPIEQVNAIVHNPHDQIPMPAGYDSVTVAPSEIHGNGLIATRPIQAGDVVAPARYGCKRTPAGRYTNHSPEPNAIFVASPCAAEAWRPDSDLYLVATRDIAVGEELTINYRQAGRAAGHMRKGPRQ